MAGTYSIYQKRRLCGTCGSVTAARAQAFRLMRTGELDEFWKVFIWREDTDQMLYVGEWDSTEQLLNWKRTKRRDNDE